MLIQPRKQDAILKKLLWIHGFVIFSLSALGQADPWSPVITDGFGSVQNYDVITFATFKDTLYAGCGRVGPGGAQLWKSGEGEQWTQVIYDVSAPSVKGIPSMSTASFAGTDYLWLGTGNPLQGTQVYRSTDGISFIPISKKGFGNPQAAVPTPNMLLFEGTNDSIPYLYAAANSHGGPVPSTVWRTPYNNTDSTRWTLLIDFSSKDPDVTQVTYFYVWQNKIYLATNGDSLLYESTDGISFTASVSVASAFLPSDLLIANIIDYQGYLYAGTNNQSPAGGQLYRTPDGTNWTNITSLLPGHSGPEDEEIHDLDTAHGYLWVTVYTDTAHTSSGMPVWRSTDETVSAFVQSNTDGFGNPDIDGENPVIMGFKGRQYFGGPNYNSGGQIWQTAMLAGIEEPSILMECMIYPNPVSKETLIYLKANGATESQVDIYDIHGRLIQSSFAPPDGKITLPETLGPGIYCYRVRTNEKAVKAGKFVVKP